MAHTDKAALRRLGSWFWPVRWWGAQALGRSSDLRAVGPLIEALADDTPEVARAAARALARMGEPVAVRVVGALDISDRRGRFGAEEALRLMGPAMGPDAVKVLARLARRDDPVRPPAAIRTLGYAGSAAAVEALLPFLGHDLLGETAMAALANTGEHQLARSVYDALRGERRALGRSKDPRAVAPLVRALRSRDPQTRTSAARGLGVLRDPRAANALIRALGDGSLSAHRAAVSALVELGSGALPRLRRATLDANRRIRVGAAEALGRQGNAVALPPAWRGRPADGDLLPTAVGRAYLGGAVGLGSLAAALGHTDPVLQCAAAAALGALGAAAAPALPALRVLAHTDGETLRQTCRAAVARIRAAMRNAPPELEAAGPLAGTGTELEAVSVPEGRGTEPEPSSPAAVGERPG